MGHAMPAEPRQKVADRLAREIPGAWRPNQFANLANPEVHYRTTGPEIWEQTGGKITAFVAGVGTGGTISGVGRCLKERNPAVRVIGADPEGSVLSGDSPRPWKVGAELERASEVRPLPAHVAVLAETLGERVLGVVELGIDLERARQERARPLAVAGGEHELPELRLHGGVIGRDPELRLEIAPGVKQVGVLAGGSMVPTTGPQLAAIQTAAPLLGIELKVIDISDKDKIEHGIVAFASSAGRGLIATRTFENFVAADLIIALAARYRLPTVYPLRHFVAAGGLASYGPNDVAEYRQVAGYVDRILKGEKPADLPVQTATKYELAINLRTARALDLAVPPTLLARADEVIE